MKTDERLGTFDAILKPHTREIQKIARALRGLIEALHPDAVETPRNGERCTTYGIGPKKMTEAYAHIMPLKTSVNLGLYHGVSLADPDGLLEGTGKAARHAKLTRLEQVNSPAIRELIKAALKERKSEASGDPSTLIGQGIKSHHVAVTDSVWNGIRRRG